ncbi:MAG TPA: hypothetical protein DCX54_11210 [Flavobacteriales bacterium]|nr:hypothetical protein [Flavobacteriales bacterium]
MTGKCVILLLLISSSVYAQNKKGTVYATWGWNRSLYTNSGIHFVGDNYDFTVKDVEARDRQSPINAETYVNPANLTIPQTNLKIGYFFKDNWSVTANIDHMKYVMVQDQTVQIDGSISGTGTEYDGVYDHEPIVLTKDFLTYEHTNGLNYVNVELNRHWNIANVESIHMQINPLVGAGLGFLYPKTAVDLIDNELADEFHLAGYGLALKVGLNIVIWKYFYLQTELKEGFINMPDVRTTNDPSDIAKQHFFFTQFNFGLGFCIPLFPADE